MAEKPVNLVIRKELLKMKRLIDRNNNDTKMNYLVYTRKYKCLECGAVFDAAIMLIPEDVSCKECDSRLVEEYSGFDSDDYL